MRMAAKAILVAKPNSFNFEDRVLLLDIPAKVGRAHKDDKSDSGNAYFDCKVRKYSSAVQYTTLTLLRQGSYGLILDWTWFMAFVKSSKKFQ